MNLANKISIGRILIVPFFVAAVLYFRLKWAAAIFIVAILSDALDGYIARRRGQRTQLGALLDPIADKLLLVSAFICFSVVKGLPYHLRLPPYVPVIIISRDIFIGGGCLVIYLIKEKVQINPTRLGKITTFFQMATIAALLFQFTHTPVLWNIAIAFTIISGLDYLKKGSRLLSEA